MLHTRNLILAITAAALALPAAAGMGWPTTSSTKSTAKVAQASPYQPSTQRMAVRSSKPARDVAAKTSTVGGFEYIGGDTGWQLAQHRYVLRNGSFVHSEDCDHVIRSAQSVNPADVDAVRNLSPGA